MKKIFSLFIAMMAVVSLSAKTIYLSPGTSTWAEANAITFVHAWGGEVTTTNVQMQPVEGAEGVLSAEIDDNNNAIVFVRMAPESTAIDWEHSWGQTIDLDIPENKNLFTITGWNDENPAKAYGEWSLYGEIPAVSIVGNFEGDASWGYGAHPMTPAADSLSASVTFAIDSAATYEMKVWVNGDYLSLNGEGETLYRIHRNWNHADNVNLVNNGRNFEFVADVAGYYTFTWTYASHNLVVEFPEIPSAVETIQTEGKSVKRIVNGELRIMRDGKTFNALGAEMK